MFGISVSQVNQAIDRGIKALEASATALQPTREVRTYSPREHVDAMIWVPLARNVVKQWCEDVGNREWNYREQAERTRDAVIKHLDRLYDFHASHLLTALDNGGPL